MNTRDGFEGFDRLWTPHRMAYVVAAPDDDTEGCPFCAMREPRDFHVRVAQQVGGDRVEVTAHLKPGIDPHDFEPKPSDLKAVANAQIVLLSAKHMEGYVGKLKDATGTKATLVEVGDKGMKSLDSAAQANPMAPSLAAVDTMMAPPDSTTMVK